MECRSISGLISATRGHEVAGSNPVLKVDLLKDPRKKVFGYGVRLPQSNTPLNTSEIETELTSLFSKAGLPSNITIGTYARRA